MEITDRKKEIFKLSSGKFIAPQIIEGKLKESAFIEQSMVVGEQEKFASALIAPNFNYYRIFNSIHFSLLRKYNINNYRSDIYRFIRGVKNELKDDL